MITLNEYYDQFLNERVTKSQLDAIEAYADKLFAVYNIDIELTRHFHDRVNDMRNNPDIQANELVDLFKGMFTKHGQKISTMKPGIEAVVTDLNSDINVPFLFKWDKRNKEYDIILKTVMRKKNFQTRTKKYHV